MTDARIAARKQRWLDFYDMSKPRQQRFLVYYLPGLEERPSPRTDNHTQRLEWSWKKYNLMMERLDWLDDDWLPYLDIFTGTEIFAAAFGCPVYFPENDMPFAQPLIHSAAEVKSLRIPSLDCPAIAPLFKIAQELRRRAGPQALLHMVDLQSPMDIAALIWEKTSFYPALIENPTAVQELSEKVHTFLTQFLDEWFNQFGPEFIAHYPDYYMPYGITLSEDEIGAVSPKVFEQFFLPELVRLSERYRAIGIHCCATARHQWNGFQQVPNLKLLNLNQPGNIIRAATGVFGSRTALWPIVADEHPFSGPGEVPAPARLVWEFSANTPEEALSIVEKMKEFG
jgi:uroporphyrinogen-III decarboxylase